METLKILYYAFVRSHLEFGSLVWNPTSKTLSGKIDTIQKRFLRYLHYKLFEYYPIGVSYEDLLTGFELLTLKKRQTHTAIMYSYDILGGRVIEPETLEKIGLRVPRQGTRGIHTFHLTTTRTNILKFSILNSAMNQYNCKVPRPRHVSSW